MSYKTLQPLKPEVIKGVIYGCKRAYRWNILWSPREMSGERAFNTMAYTKEEVERIARVAFDIAMKRDRRVCSVDKANVLEVSQFWRDIVTRYCTRSE